MAKSHVIQLYLEAENQYFEMLANVKDFQEMVEQNLITQEEYINFTKEVDQVKQNYMTLGYFMFTLNLPRKKSKKPDAQTMSWYNTLKHESKRGLLDENADVLCEMKKLLNEKKKKEKTNGNK